MVFRGGAPDGPSVVDRWGQRAGAGSDAHPAARSGRLYRVRRGDDPGEDAGRAAAAPDRGPAARAGRRSRGATPRSISSIRIAGEGLDEAKARRAIDLSLEKYCSVVALPRPGYRDHAMALRWLSAVAALAAAAGRAAGAQQVKELGVQAIGTLSDPALAVGGVYAAWRPARRARLSASLGLGGSRRRGGLAGRAAGSLSAGPHATRRERGSTWRAASRPWAGRTDQGYWC